jgi:selenocysteine lyase/cysteine desulfurase
MNLELSRRRFVLGSLSLPGVALVDGGVGAAAARPPAPPRSARLDPELSGWRAVRAQFRLDPKLTHFATFILSSHPEPVRRRIAEHRAALDADPYTHVSANKFFRDQEVASAAAAYLGTDPELIALTDSTTMGLALVYRTVRLAAGEEVLTTEHDHYSTHESLRLRGENGVMVRKVRLYPPRTPELATADEVVETLRRAIGPSTRLVAITWVHSSSGVKLPVRRIADALATLNAGRSPEQRVMLVVDGVHGLGAERPRIEELGCDVFVAGCHKWLWGPRGTGLVWAKPAAWERIRPVIPSFDPRVYGSWLLGRTLEAPPGPTMTRAAFTRLSTAGPCRRRLSSISRSARNASPDARGHSAAGCARASPRCQASSFAVRAASLRREWSAARSPGGARRRS